MRTHISPIAKQRISDFFTQEDGNVGRKNALTAGTILSGAMLAATMFAPQAANAGDCPDDEFWCGNKRGLCCNTGGWTDLIPFARETDGFVLNAAIDLYASAILTPQAEKVVTFQSADAQQRFCLQSAPSAINGLSLPEAIILTVRPRNGYCLALDSKAPKGVAWAVRGQSALSW